MKYLLDSNAVIALLRNDAGFMARIRQQNPNDVAISAIVAHELFYGAYKSARASENLARVEALRFDVVEFDKEDAHRAGELRATLAGTGRPIGPYDALIAGQALSRDLILVTRNGREFDRVAGLRVENWES